MSRAPALEWSVLDGVVCLRVLGATSPVAVYPTSLAGVRPMAGRSVVDATGVCFVPRYPFVDGTSYTVVMDGSCSLEIERPATPSGAPPEVLAVYPSGAVLPRNALRMYVHFSHPMREGDAGEHVRLDDALLRLRHELWDPERRRLTLLLDPARIKRGLAPHDEAGYPLVEGGAATLVVDAEMRDATGRPLASRFEKRYTVGPDVRELVRPEAWACRAPAAGSRDDLVLEFGRPLDHGLLQHSLDVEGVAGSGQASSGEASWRFTPAAPWEAGGHRVVVDAALEDVAGNSVVRIFDRDLRNPGDAPRSAGPAALDFTVAR